MFVYCESCVLSGTGLCDEPITRQEESYRLWCVVVCDLETWRMRGPWPALGRSATGGKNIRLIFGPLDRIRDDKLLDYFTISIPSVWQAFVFSWMYSNLSLSKSMLIGAISAVTGPNPLSNPLYSPPWTVSLQTLNPTSSQWQ